MFEVEILAGIERRTIAGKTAVQVIGVHTLDPVR
jgi:hypothetical protein